jgi:ABC-type multidrug transport system permease subunit
VLPLVTEDRGWAGEIVGERLGAAPGIAVRPLPSRRAARAVVRRQHASAALVVPAGTSEAIAAGHGARLVLFTDPVRSIEVARVRAVVQELRHGLEQGARARADRELAATRLRAQQARDDVVHAAAALDDELASLRVRLAAVERESRERAAATRRTLATSLALVRAEQAGARDRLAARLRELRGFLTALASSERDFQAWLAVVHEKAGRFADRVPPPPTPPTVPPALRELADLEPDELVARLVPSGDLPALPALELPAIPEIELPALPLPPEPPSRHLPGGLAIRESSVTGASRQPNTFDQNVPGFSITFLLLGVLLGVSLGFLDERDWGTLERLRTTPAPWAAVVLAKLLARAAVGMGQMLLLLVVGRAVFGVSLGPQPVALLLPTTGIVLAGTSFGLVIAALIQSREAVLPVGSIVILTMAAVGGCWWPIDLEPTWMRKLALAFPTTWAMEAYNDLMIRRRSAGAVLAATAVLLGHAVAYLGVGLALFRRRIVAGR